MSNLVLVLNGPNLNLLGVRQPDIYGAETLADIERQCHATAAELDIKVRFHQSNYEPDLIQWIHEGADSAAGLVINPGAFSHTSVAILDALNGFDHPVIEVHITNIYKRESFRRHSYISLASAGIITGFGAEGYALALRHLASLIHGDGKVKSIQSWSDNL